MLAPQRRTGPGDPLEVVTMGRIGVDLYPAQTGVPLPEVASFNKYLGGSPANVAVAAARYGRRAAIVTKVGDDPFGTYVRAALAAFGVDDRFVGTDPDNPTPITFCEVFPPDDFPLYFYRHPKAPDLNVTAAELDAGAVAAAQVFWATVTGLCAEPSRAATLAALEASRPCPHTVLDLDWRPMFWDSPAEAGPWIRRALAFADVAVGNLDEVEVAVGVRDPREAAKRLRGLGVRLAVVKQGPKGVLAVDDSGEVELPPAPVEVVNGLGAGDAFGGALVDGLLAGLPLETVIARANAAGAIVAGRLACSAAMPTAAEVDAKLREAADAR
ncbi:5-dehydro-2-deoxygluconokinase [Glycomyces terrestris]|uniref:5-dehydro-2-deoxygluconokinase n=1 Tax=Glycomyces terrestris TaxID=2493553 RepID=A0A426V1R0_9ACTN|nr:5-dehydro-2-deoxygluconokinase [Glycomyces terrestris]RRS00773.1 5-dehydro-2-deoxygluconokinase [Glycomyces terrestris]